MGKELIIEIPYGGLGDHLFHSHLPRIAKETGAYEKVFISEYSLYRHTDNKKLVWELNPYVDGFVMEHGRICDLKLLVEKLNPTSQNNLLDEVMLAFKLNNNKTWNEPEVYYQCKDIENYKHVIYDPNYLSWIGNVTAEDFMHFFKKHKIKFEAIMKKRSEKYMFIPDSTIKVIETPTLFDFCDLIHSCSKLFCLTSGTATLAAALNKNATVFYGKDQYPGYQHYSKHKYYLIKSSIVNKIKTKLNIILR